MENKRSNLLYLFVFIIILILNCKYISSKKGNFILEKKKNGIVISEEQFDNDTIKQGISKYYYDSGKLKDEIEYKNGIKNGIQRHYFENGVMESKTTNKNGLQEGLTYFYYDNGNVKSIGNKVNGKDYGLIQWYYLNGQMELLNIIDFASKVLFIQQFDKNGNKIKEDGLSFSPDLIFNYPKNELLIGKDIVIKFTVSDVPGYITTIKMGVLGNSMSLLPVKNFTATYKCNFNKPGKFTLITTGEIRTMNNVLVKKDSISTIVKINESLNL